MQGPQGINSGMRARAWWPRAARALRADREAGRGQEIAARGRAAQLQEHRAAHDENDANHEDGEHRCIARGPGRSLRLLLDMFPHRVSLLLRRLFHLRLHPGEIPPELHGRTCYGLPHEPAPAPPFGAPRRFQLAATPLFIEGHTAPRPRAGVRVVVAFFTS